MLEANSKPEGQQSNLYEADFYAWTQQQVDLLRHHKWHQLDLDNLIEEIDSLGIQAKREIRSRLGVLIQHLLKWEYQPDKRTRSWLSTVRVQRMEIEDLLNENPSLVPGLDEARSKAYRKAVELTIGETNLPKQTFPQECPYSIVRLLDDRFYPGSPSNLIETDD